MLAGLDLSGVQRSTWKSDESRTLLSPPLPPPTCSPGRGGEARTPSPHPTSSREGGKGLWERQGCPDLILSIT